MLGLAGLASWWWRLHRYNFLTPARSAQLETELTAAALQVHLRPEPGISFAQNSSGLPPWFDVKNSLLYYRGYAVVDGPLPINPYTGRPMRQLHLRDSTDIIGNCLCLQGTPTRDLENTAPLMNGQTRHLEPMQRHTVNHVLVFVPLRPGQRPRIEKLGDEPFTPLGFDEEWNAVVRGLTPRQAFEQLVPRGGVPVMIY